LRIVLSLIILEPNARGEPRPEAEARHERKLEGVGSSALFGAGFEHDSLSAALPAAAC